jgi:hypothetical protein
MTGEPNVSDGLDEGRVAERAAELLPEELATGSADPKAQAAAILADSDAREAGALEQVDGVREDGAVGALEHRRSPDTFPTGDATP